MKVYAINEYISWSLTSYSVGGCGPILRNFGGSKKAKLEEGFGSVWDMDTLYSPLTAETCQHPFSKTKNFEWSTRRRGVPNWNTHIECHSWFQYVEKGATKETARANSMGCMQPRSYIAHAFSFASKKYQIEENKTDIPRKVSESTA